MFYNINYGHQDLKFPFDILSVQWTAENANLYKPEKYIFPVCTENI